MSTIVKLRHLMDKKHNIRNITVIGHINHGKSTLTSNLIAAAGTIQSVAQYEVADTRADEAEYGFTIKSVGTSLYYEMSEESLKYLNGERDGNEYLINLVDSPGHVDFSAEVTAALRVTDGALVVVDCVEGVSVQTETVLRQALSERIRPVLTVNKMDRFLLDLQIDGEEAYMSFQRVIEDANAIMATYEDPFLGDVQIYPEKGTVAFSSGLYGWAFSLKTFAHMYALKFKVDETKMTERLWGENFFDPSTKMWTKKNTGSSTCKRGFVQFCYEPIRQIIDSCMDNQKDKLWFMLQKLGVRMQPEERDLVGKALMKRVMQAWLPASSALLEMLICHLPSPVTAQQYRAENLYEGPLHDKYATAIRNCDSGGPLMVYISKLIPASDMGRFFAHGRVFSGKISSGSKVRIMGPKYVPGQKNDLYIQSVQRTLIWMGKRCEPIEDVPSGNLVALVGLDYLITKTATLTNEEELYAYPIRAMKFSVSPVVRVAVQCKIPANLLKLINGLKCLVKSDPLVVCSVEESGEHVIAGSGELHLAVCVKSLVDFMSGEEIIVSDPLVSFRETVSEKSDRIVMSTSPNQNNHIYIEALPLDEGLAEAIEQGRIGPGDDLFVRAHLLNEEFGWNAKLAKKIWCFGPETTGPNMVLDITKGVEYMNELKNVVTSEFQWITNNGALAEESMHGIRFNICDAIFHNDAKQRKYNQLTPMFRQATLASQLTAKPRLMEPVYLVNIEAPGWIVPSVCGVIYKNKGRILEQIQRPGTQIYTVSGYVPVTESFGFSNALRVATLGQAILQCAVFDHWEIIPSDPFTAGSRASQIVSKIRMQKGLKELTHVNFSED